MAQPPVVFLVILGLLGVAGAHLGCGGGSPAGPTPPSTQPPPATVAPPSITAIAPTTGSTGGGTPLKITGSGFQSSATATVDGERVTVTFENSSSIRLTTPIHGTGAVDIVVTNSDGQLSRRVGGFTYAPPQSFNFNGTWVGSALAHPELGLAPRHSDMEMQFTVQDGQLTSFACGGPAATFSQPPIVTNGEFSFVRSDGGKAAGRIVADAAAIGTIDTADCPATRWTVTKP